MPTIEQHRSFNTGTAEQMQQIWDATSSQEQHMLISGFNYGSFAMAQETNDIDKTRWLWAHLNDSQVAIITNRYPFLPIMIAAYEGNLQSAQTYWARATNQQAITNNLSWILPQAASSGNVELFYWLLSLVSLEEARENFSRLFQASLSAAAMNGHSNMVVCLWSNRAQVTQIAHSNIYAAHEALAEGHVQVAHYLYLNSEPLAQSSILSALNDLDYIERGQSLESVQWALANVSAQVAGDLFAFAVLSMDDPEQFLATITPMQLENFIRHNDFNAIKIALVNNEAAIALDLFNRISFQQQVNLAQNHGHHVASLAIRAQCPGLVTGIFAAATGATKSQLLEQDNYILAELPLLFNNRASFAILWSAANLAQKRGIIAAFPEVILHAAGWRDLDLVQQAFYIMDRDLREPTLLAHQGYLFTDPAHEATNQDRALARWVWTVAPDNVKEYFITSTNAMGRPLFEFCTTHASEELRFMIYDKALHWQIPEKKAAMLRAISYETIMPYRSYNWAENFRTITQNAVSLPSGLTAHPLNIEAAYKISQYTCAKITWQDFALLMDIQRLSITAKGAGGAAKELYNKATDIAAKQDPEGVTRGESYFWAAASILLNPANAALKQEFNVQRSTFSTSVTGNDQPNLEQTPKSNKRRRIEMPATPQMFNRHLPSENPHTPRGRDMALNLSESFDQRHI